MHRLRSCSLDAPAAVVADGAVVVVDAAVEFAVVVPHVAVDDDEEELAGFGAAPASLAAAAVVAAAGAGVVAERGSGLEKVERRVQLQVAELALQRNPARCCCNRSQRRYPVAVVPAVVPQQARRRAQGS